MFGTTRLLRRVYEIKPITGQLLFKFMSKKKGAARKPKQTRHPQRDE